MSEDTPGQAPAFIAVHVFSGVHLGAHIELTAGSWLFGSTDECDIIVNGLAPRHALLHVTLDESGTVHVTATPDEGPLTVNGAKADGETPLESGQAWYLGETCFAWNLPGVLQETIIPRLDSTSQDQAAGTRESAQDLAKAQSEAKESGEEAVQPACAAAPEPTHDAIPETAAFQPVHRDEPQETPRVPWSERLRRPLPLLCLAVLLCALSVVVSSGPKQSEYPAVVCEILEKVGLTGLAVTERWPGVEVRGAVAAASELERLQQAVEEVSFPVYLEVAVDDDMLRAVRNALGVRGFFPVVSMDRSKGEPRLRVAVFMRDTLVEADAFAKLENDVPPPPVKERYIVYASDVVPHLVAALQNAGFGDIHPVCLPGRITLTGNLAPEREVVLSRLKSGLSARFGVPLFGEGEVGSRNAGLSSPPHGVALRLPVTPEPAKPSDHVGETTNPLGDVTITGVFLAPMHFVTTADGRSLFEGSVLPGGNVLERISSSGLRLRRGDKVFIYSLRGNHE